MAQCGKVACLSSVKNILSLHNHVDAGLSDVELTAKLKVGLQIGDAGKVTQLIWEDAEGSMCTEIFPRGLKMGEGKWTYSPIMFKPTPWTPEVLIDVAHLDGTYDLQVEGYNHIRIIKEVLFHFKMDADACGWDHPVTFSASFSGNVVASRQVDMKEYMNKPGYHYLSLGGVNASNHGTGGWVAKMSETSASNKKGLTMHGILFRNHFVN